MGSRMGVEIIQNPTFPYTFPMLMHRMKILGNMKSIMTACLYINDHK